MMKKRVSRKGNRFLNKMGKIGLRSQSEDLIEGLTVMMSGGMGVVETFNAVLEEVPPGRMKRIAKEMRRSLDSGRPLWRTLEESGLFEGQTISLVRMGEDSGRLNENLRLVVRQQAKNREFRARLRSAMVYPAFVVAAMVILGLAIAWFILPMLATVFGQMEMELPLLTSLLIGVGEFFEEHGAYFVPGALIVIIASYLLIFTFPRTKFIGQAIMLSLPGIGHLAKNVEIARFGHLLGMLLEAGIPITQALDSIASSTETARYRRLYRHLERSIADGHSIQKSIRSYDGADKLIPASVRHLIAAGERSGKLSETLLKTGESFEAKVEILTKNLAAIIEPVLLIIVWFGVMMVALAVLMPIYGLIGGF